MDNRITLVTFSNGSKMCLYQPYSSVKDPDVSEISYPTITEEQLKTIMDGTLEQVYNVLKNL